MGRADFKTSTSITQTGVQKSVGSPSLKRKRDILQAYEQVKESAKNTAKLKQEIQKAKYTRMVEQMSKEEDAESEESEEEEATDDEIDPQEVYAAFRQGLLTKKDYMAYMEKIAEQSTQEDEQDTPTDSVDGAPPPQAKSSRREMELEQTLAALKEEQQVLREDYKTKITGVEYFMKTLLGKEVPMTEEEEKENRLSLLAQERRDQLGSNIFERLAKQQKLEERLAQYENFTKTFQQITAASAQPSTDKTEQKKQTKKKSDTTTEEPRGKNGGVAEEKKTGKNNNKTTPSILTKADLRKLTAALK